MTELRFNEQWCTPEIRSALSHHYNMVEDLGGSVIEIGCWEGLSSVHLANHIDPETLICIDTFAGTPYEVYEVEIYAERDIEANFRHNIEHGTHGNVDIYKMGWEEYFSDNEDVMAKFIYVDGPHGYDDVCYQLSYLRDRLVAGGIMIGDDYQSFPSVRQAVHDTFGTEAVQIPTSPQTWVWKKLGN